MRLLVCLLFFVFGVQNGWTQESIMEFEIHEGERANIQIQDIQVLVERESNKERQLLMKLISGMENIEVMDINKDGFQDIVLHLKWTKEYNQTHVFIYNQHTAEYEPLNTQGYPLLTKEPYLNGRLTSVHTNDNGWSEFSFNSDKEIYKSLEVRSFNFPYWLIGEIYFYKEYNVQGEVIDSYFLSGRYEVVNLHAQVDVSKVDLYKEPSYFGKTKGYLIFDDEFRIIDVQDGRWIKISYDSETHGEIQAWINLAELWVDKHSLDTSIVDTRDGKVNISFLYPYHSDMFYFTIGVNNMSAYPFVLKQGRILILLENREGKRILYDLYSAMPLDLPPKSLRDTYGQNEEGNWYVPGALLDDNRVEWDEQLQKFLIFDNIDFVDTYPEFIPTTIPEGQYNMYVVMVNSSYPSEPIISNVQEVRIPLPKTPIEYIEETN